MFQLSLTAIDIFLSENAECRVHEEVNLSKKSLRAALSQTFYCISQLTKATFELWHHSVSDHCLKLLGFLFHTQAKKYKLKLVCWSLRLVCWLVLRGFGHFSADQTGKHLAIESVEFTHKSLIEICKTFQTINKKELVQNND